MKIHFCIPQQSSTRQSPASFLMGSPNNPQFYRNDQGQVSITTQPERIVEESPLIRNDPLFQQSIIASQHNTEQLDDNESDAVESSDNIEIEHIDSENIESTESNTSTLVNQPLVLSRVETFLYQQMMENQKVLLNRVHDIEQGIKQVLQALQDPQKKPNPLESDDESTETGVEQFFQMKTHADLQKLEQMLANDAEKSLKKAFTQRCTQIVGTREASDIDGRSAALELATNLFHSEFWWLVSWRGGSRDEAEPKFALCDHVQFLAVFKKIVRKATRSDLSDALFTSVFQSKMKNRTKPGTEENKIKRKSATKIKLKAKKIKPNDPVDEANADLEDKENSENKELNPTAANENLNSTAANQNLNPENANAQAKGSDDKVDQYLPND